MPVAPRSATSARPAAGRPAPAALALFGGIDTAPAAIGSHQRPPRLTVISNGAGQQSTLLNALAALDPDWRATWAPEDLVVATVDTGDEHRSTREHIALLQRFNAVHGLEYHFLTPDLGWHSPTATDLVSFHRRNATIGSTHGFRSTCTTRLKLDTLYRWLDAYVARRYGFRHDGQKGAIKQFAAHYGPIRMLIGIGAEETRRATTTPTGKRWFDLGIDRRYPLVAMGLDRAAVAERLSLLGVPVPSPSLCVRCHWKSLPWILYTARTEPAKWAEWCELEANKLAKFRHKAVNHGVFGPKRLPDVLAEATAQYGHLDAAALEALCFSHGCVGTVH